MNKETEDWLNDQAKNYKGCLMAVVKNIPPKISKDLELSASDMKDIASNLFIQGQKAGVFREEGDPQPPRMEYDDSPSTNPQQELMARLATELGKESEDLIDQHLRICGKKVVDALTKTEATELINKLMEEKRVKKNRGPSLFIRGFGPHP